jgi:hypothetical protein
MSFLKVLNQYGKSVQRQIDRTPGPNLNSKRVKAITYYKESMHKICALGPAPEGAPEGFIMRTAEELEPVRMGFNKFVVIKEAE